MCARDTHTEVEAEHYEEEKTRVTARRSLEIPVIFGLRNVEILRASENIMENAIGAPAVLEIAITSGVYDAESFLPGCPLVTRRLCRSSLCIFQRERERDFSFSRDSPDRRKSNNSTGRAI